MNASYAGRQLPVTLTAIDIGYHKDPGGVLCKSILGISNGELYAHLSKQEYDDIVSTKLQTDLAFFASLGYNPRYFPVTSACNAAKGILITDLAQEPLHLLCTEYYWLPRFPKGIERGDAELTVQALNSLGPSLQSTLNWCTNFGKANSLGVATQFLFFPFLPAEIRAMIWAMAANHPRFLEIEHQRLPTHPHSRHFDAFYAVSPSSRRAPPIWNACTESAFEAAKYYKYTELDFQHPFEQERAVLFNPAADIILFRSGSCLTTLKQFCAVVGFRGLDIRQIAVSNTESFHQCCTWDLDDPLHFALSTLSTRVAVYNKLTMITLLGGFVFVPGIQTIFFPGIRLAKIFLIIDSNLARLRHGGIDYSTTCRPAKVPGRDEAETNILRDISDHHSLVLHAVPECLPEIECVSLYSIGAEDNGNTLFSALTFSAERFHQLGLHLQDSIKTIQDTTGCRIVFPETGPNHLEHNPVVELGFKGTWASVAEAESVVLSLQVSCSRRYPYPIRAFTNGQAGGCTPRSKHLHVPEAKHPRRAIKDVTEWIHTPGLSTWTPVPEIPPTGSPTTIQHAERERSTLR
ncbi:hypothetical protein MBM_09149 [Drepanopeziza brunnea f. sp. 'multigermtubi' MB_m1]|uniref:2EXR domain-containing protein n=1 Tax=Marssonina brunnea f. sp. multigermtubi (strain MB_m1) TaxID=1072389 RepID=K1W6I0_MARBU|nr:uncharacterized protein MBM_09149 [Drepanopeziza brunnea f. sp. 'multigermtubi' MB_m1]EKD12580.1 hypothetical protein MBM_09149 [Drepanopeziza brunnea f. sp. 'multigermtubi' MB_m1]